MFGPVAQSSRAFSSQPSSVARVVRPVEPVALLETGHAEPGLREPQPDHATGRAGADDQDVRGPRP